MRRFVRRHQPATSHATLIKAGLGGTLAIAFVGWLGNASGVPLLIAPFGATVILLFGIPGTPLAQPINVVGGHLLGTAIGLVLRGVLPPEWWAVGLGVGLTLAAMMLLRVTHPPAGANPILVFLGDPGPWFLLTPVLAGSVALVLFATAFHRLPPTTPYPLPRPTSS
ncbi:MAG: HPP family protein [Alphaproteobacteria bacterium]